MSEPFECIVSIAKFRDYIFKEGATHGKAVLYHRLGYFREHSEELAQIYQTQGAAKFRANEFALGAQDEFGQRITIEIVLPGIREAQASVSYVKSGWMLRPDGSLSLNTPFTGFSQDRNQENEDAA